MSRAIAVVALTSGVTTNVQLGVNPDQVQAVRIANESPYALLIITPNNGGYWLPAYMEDMITCDQGSGSILAITPQALPGTGFQSNPSSSALITVYDQTDTIPEGSWPLALSRQTNIGNLLNINTQATFQIKHVDIASGSQGNVFIVPASNETAYITGFTISGYKGVATIEYNISLSGVNSTSDPDWIITSTTTGGCFQNVIFPQAQPATSPGTQIGIHLNTIANADVSLVIYGYHI